LGGAYHASHHGISAIRLLHTPTRRHVDCALYTLTPPPTPAHGTRQAKGCKHTRTRANPGPRLSPRLSPEAYQRVQSAGARARLMDGDHTEPAETHAQRKDPRVKGRHPTDAVVTGRRRTHVLQGLAAHGRASSRRMPITPCGAHGWAPRLRAAGRRLSTNHRDGSRRGRASRSAAAELARTPPCRWRRP